MGREAEALEVFRKNQADGVGTGISQINIRMLERKLAPAAPAAP